MPGKLVLQEELERRAKTEAEMDRHATRFTISLILLFVMVVLVFQVFSIFPPGGFGFGPRLLAFLASIFGMCAAYRVGYEYAHHEMLLSANESDSKV